MAYNIVFGVDENYVPYLWVAIKSTISNISNDDTYVINILHCGISDFYAEKIKKMEIKNTKIKLINISDLIMEIENSMVEKYHFSKAMYFRFLIPDLFPEEEKVLYLDCDIVVKGNPNIFFEKINLKDNYIAAVNDLSMINKKLPYTKYPKSILGVENQKYFNSGVIIFNIKALKNINLFEKFKELLPIVQDFDFPDQDMLNIICKEHVYYIDYKFNYLWETINSNCKKEDFLNEQMFEEYIKNYNDIKILHYASYIKPWNNLKMEFSDIFWKYAIKSPFFVDILKQNNISLFQIFKYLILYKIFSIRNYCVKSKKCKLLTILGKKKILKEYP